MSDRIRVVGGGVLGAAIGAMGAYLLLTEDGREKLSRAKPALEDLSRVLHDCRVTLARVGGVAVEGRRVAGDVLAALRSDVFANPANRWQ